MSCSTDQPATSGVDPRSGVGAARAGVDALVDAPWWQVPDADLLGLARDVEHLSRLLSTVQVHLAGEVDTRRFASSHGAASTGALLRSVLVISAGEAKHRVLTARAVLPHPTPTGTPTPPVLPVLSAALTAGTVGVDQTRTILATMTGLPDAVDQDTRDFCEAVLVEHAPITEPRPFAIFARAVAVTCDPDGSLDRRDPADRVELTVGPRNPRTGLTRLTGLLDDIGVELLGQSLNGLTTPRPAPDGSPDPRSAATRRAQGFTEMLRRYLDSGTAPVTGGHKPHLTLTMTLTDLQHRTTSTCTGAGGCNGVEPGSCTGERGCSGTGGERSPGAGAGSCTGAGGCNSTGAGGGFGLLDHGGPITAAKARMIACDAEVLPIVLGSASQVLDVGRATRVFPTSIRRALIHRDKGCAFPGCDRPPAWADGHHLVHWADGGPTSLANAVLVCRLHHSLIHRGDWTVRLATDHRPEFIPPPWIDPDQKPRRNTLHHLPDRR